MLLKMYEAQKKRADFEESRAKMFGKQLEILTNKLKDPVNRTHKTTLQQCKMFDGWLAEIKEKTDV